MRAVLSYDTEKKEENKIRYGITLALDTGSMRNRSKSRLIVHYIVHKMIVGAVNLKKKC